MWDWKTKKHFPVARTTHPLGVGIGGGGTVGGVSICMDDDGTAELDAEAPGTYACGAPGPLSSTFG